MDPDSFSYTALLQDDQAAEVIDAMMAIDSQGYTIIKCSQPCEEKSAAVEAAIGSELYEVKKSDETPTHHFEGPFMSQKWTAANEFMDYGVNMTYICQAFLDIPFKRARFTKPRVVRRIETTSELRPLKMRVRDHQPGQVVSLIRPFRTSLSPENGFFSVYIGSHKMGDEEFEELEKHGALTLREVRVRPDDILIVAQGLRVKYANGKGAIWVWKAISNGLAGASVESQVDQY